MDLQIDLCQRNLIKLVDSIQDYSEVQKVETAVQIKLTARLLLISQRMQVFRRNLPAAGGGDDYSRNLTEDLECAVSEEFNDNVVKIYNSLDTLQKSLDSLELDYRIFNDTLKTLNWHSKSVLINGNVYQKPLLFYVEHVTDILHYLKYFYVQLKIASRFNKIGKSDLICNYKTLLKPASDFDESLNRLLLFSKQLKKNVYKVKC